MATATRDQIDQFMAAISGGESGGKYDPTNPDSGAHGKYQIMPANWPSWAQEAGLSADAPQTPQNQEIVARHKMLALFDDLGSWQAVAVAWYAGEGAAKKWLNNPEAPEFNRPQMSNGHEYPSINEYSGRVSRALGDPAAAGGAAPTDTTVTAQGAPTPAPAAHPTTFSSPEEIQAYIEKTYPNVAPFFGDPEIKWILYDAAVNGKDDTEIEAAIRQTDYWKSHGPDARNFDAFIAADPKGAGQLVDQAKTIVSQLFQRNGVTLDDKTTGDLAKEAIKSGAITINGQVANQSALNAMVAFDLGATSGAVPAGGDTGATADTLSAIAKAYLIPVDPGTLKQWSLRILQGTATQDGFTSYVKNLAKGQWANDKDVVSAIDQGIAPGDFFAPMRNAVASTLEMSPDQIDLQDPRYRDITQFYDPAAKQRRAMTIGEATSWARHQPQFKQTAQFATTKADQGMTLVNFLGKVA